VSISRSSADAAEDLMLWTSGLPYGLASLDERLACIETSKNDDLRTVKLTQEVCDLLDRIKARSPASEW
jgi:hypothetical protein